ncbi:MAG: tRNA lysidine(34) synthetase TilS [Paludibacteraceae bacterium]|nr:tRNA lysidine(34) synthetase TilS [Paludibacteraceae bacterium]
MLRRVKKFIADKHLPASGNRVLVCVSGGADSVALLDVLLRAGYECVVAHCNFHLRSKESDRDEQFVRNLVERFLQRDYVKALPLEVKHFNTLDYAQEQNMSVETAARELRYEWFGLIAEQYNCKAIAVAHHQNDQAETVMMHIRRGCGLNGLCGMRPSAPNPVLQKCEQDKPGKDIPVIRPLLCTTHDYICHYLRDIRGIEWMEDSTNDDTRFKRNAVREELKSWSKAEIEHIAQLAERIQEVCRTKETENEEEQ